MDCLNFELAGGDCDSCLCKLGVCKDKGNGMGLGWGHLALQLGNLYPSRHSEIWNTLRSQWQGLGHSFGEQGLVSPLF